MNLLRRGWSHVAARWPRRRAAVVDACLLFNELDLLDLRLNEIGDVVDRFVVVEAAFSHAGVRKPLLFAENRERFAPFHDKIAYFTLSDPPIAAPRDEAERSALERFQRDAIGAALEPLGLADRDVVIVSDVDEIPRGTTIASLDGRLASSRYAVFVQRLYHRYVNHAWPAGTPAPEWLGSVACRYRSLRKVGAHQVRRGGNRAGLVLGKPDPRWSYVEDGGWHLTWMGGAEAGWTKAQNVLHVLEKASGLRDLGPSMPIRVFPADVSRDQCREIQGRYLAEAEAPAFTALDFDRFAVEQDVPEHMRRNRERFRRYFFFTSGL